MDYERQMKYFSDHANTLAFAEKKGVAIGREEGVAIGEARGLEKAARSMLADGLDPARVARITRLPKKRVMALRQAAFGGGAG